MGRRETQRSIIASEAYWGSHRRLIPGCVLPETARVESVSEEQESEGTRYVSYIPHEDGSYEIRFDPAVAPDNLIEE